MNNMTKIGKYIFIDGILQPQTIEKGLLSYFYECTPSTFRSQIQKKGIIDLSDRSKTFTKAETEQIFAEFGPVYYDFAIENYKKWLLFKANKKIYNKKYSKKALKLSKFSINHSKF
ncbi:MAG: hypothetical protein K5685_01110 [Bacteroidales bacterium]|nr:hypothetical protein [Bacteroidales bacterium]